MKHGQSVNLGCFRVEFIKTNHRIQDASALAIFSPVGIVLHTGDFKIDYTPVFGDPIDLQRFAELGKKGVLAMLADSTNAVSYTHLVLPDDPGTGWYAYRYQWSGNAAAFRWY